MTTTLTACASTAWCALPHAVAVAMQDATPTANAQFATELAKDLVKAVWSLTEDHRRVCLSALSTAPGDPLASIAAVQQWETQHPDLPRPQWSAFRAVTEALKVWALVGGEDPDAAIAAATQAYCAAAVAWRQHTDALFAEAVGEAASDHLRYFERTAYPPRAV